MRQLITLTTLTVLVLALGGCDSSPAGDTGADTHADDTEAVDTSAAAGMDTGDRAQGVDHRATATACADPAADPRAATCDSSTQGGTCGANSDCGPSQVCLLEDDHSHACQCYGAACLTDDDCGVGRACVCGVATAGASCGTFRQDCGHRCVPAGCKSDGDCAGPALCVAVHDSCGAVTRYVCNDLQTSACASDDDCRAAWMCSYDDDHGWRCVPKPTCF